MSLSFPPDKFNIKGLKQLAKAVKLNPPVARIGILGSKDHRKEEGSSNATIGAAHEFGSIKRGLPARSFLRVPIKDHMQDELDNAGAFTEEAKKQVIKDGSLLPWMKKAAVLAEEIVKKAFDTKGYGKWKSWKDPNYTNETGQVLVDTTQLRDSITSDVRERA